MRWLGITAAFALASLAQAVDWAQDVSAHFVEPHSREHVQAVATEKSKPVMVIAMTSWCAACSALRSSVNSGTKVKLLLDKFTVAYAPEEGAENVWTEAGQNYVPQVYFHSADGKQLHVYNAGQFKYYFADEDSLEKAMQKALSLAKEGSTGQAHPGEAAAAVAETDHKKDVFDPAHAFDSSIAGHFLANLQPEAVRQKAVEGNRPFMVLLTQSWCQACVDLIHSVNGGNHTKDLLSAFVVNNAHGQDGLRNWQPEGENYVPQALFFDADGTPLDVKGRVNLEYKHYFSTDAELGAAMAEALDASKSPGEL